jgi:hypothetical protein
MSRPLPHALTPIWLTLHQTIERHIDAGDRDEFLDTIVTIANQHDSLRGKGAGDAYIARVIQSLTGHSTDADKHWEP